VTERELAVAGLDDNVYRSTDCDHLVGVADTAEQAVALLSASVPTLPA
jgi:hypothetical protein